MSYDCNCCQRRFRSDYAQWQHKVEKNHFDYECSCCYMTFETEQMRKEHEVDRHHYCADCERQFTSLNNTQQHLRSAAHLGSSITCPFCKRGFTTATGLVHHIESSACPRARNLDRDAVYRIVRQKDPSGVISKKLIGWTGSDSFEATARAWNPYEGAYECYLCPRTFGQLSSLNQHLQSPARALIASDSCVLFEKLTPAQTSRSCTTARSVPRSSSASLPSSIISRVRAVAILASTPCRRASGVSRMAAASLHSVECGWVSMESLIVVCC